MWWGVIMVLLIIFLTIFPQAAQSEVASGGQVLFVLPKKLADIPPIVHGMPQPTEDIMEKIKFL